MTDFESDDNPGDPKPEDLSPSSALDLVSAIALTNYGAYQEVEGVSTFELEEMPAAAVTHAATRTLPLDIAKARAFLDSCMTSSPRVTYGLGAKVHPHGAKPGSGFKKVDCSGFVREAIWRASSPGMNFPDGSVVQHDWVRAQGFQRGNREDGLLQDGTIRIAFFRPQEAPPPRHIGHVALIFKGRTLESHGGTGPNSRAWTNTGWQAKTFVYVLSQ